MQKTGRIVLVLLGILGFYACTEKPELETQYDHPIAAKTTISFTVHRATPTPSLKSLMIFREDNILLIEPHGFVMVGGEPVYMSADAPISIAAMDQILNHLTTNGYLKRATKTYSTSSDIAKQVKHPDLLKTTKYLDDQADNYPAFELRIDSVDKAFIHSFILPFNKQADFIKLLETIKQALTGNQDAVDKLSEIQASASA